MPWAWLFLGIGFFTELCAQTSSVEKAVGKNPLLAFDNIEKEQYYYHRLRLARIYDLEEKENWSRLARRLKSYVENFGIENFGRDTYLLWKLAKATELSKGLAQAKSYYRLALRHYQGGMSLEEVELYHQLLNQHETELYVPLDYYYKLVESRRYMDTLRAPRGRILNMGELINSDRADYAPSLDREGNQLFFTSNRHDIRRSLYRKQKNEDIFVSERNDYGTWELSQPLESINTKKHNEGSVCVRADGKKLYFSRCDALDGYGDCDLYEARWQAQSQTWGEVRNLGSTVNSPSWDSHPALSVTGDTLYFASDRVGGFGLSDLYFVYLVAGRWHGPKNLGPYINTKRNEVSPFVHPMRRVLYFSSDGQLFNFGGFDIYRSAWNSTHRQWNEPWNIGPLVNGEGSEHYFTIDPQAHFMYYAKSQNENMDGQDLYAFPVPMEGHPLATTLLQGSLSDEQTGDPFEGIAMVIDLENGREVSPKYLDERGRFQFRLIDGGRYLLVVEGDDFFRIEEIIELSGDTQLDLTTQPLSRRVQFSSIKFESEKADILPSMYHQLNEIARFLENHPNVLLEIGGHTDAQGSRRQNLKLSHNRANNIRTFLLERSGNIAETRIKAQGFGSMKPIVEPEKTEEDRSINRRVEFHFIKSTE